METTAKLTTELQDKAVQHMYRVLSRTSETILKVRSEDELFTQICEIAAEGSEFLAAALFMYDPKINGLRFKEGSANMS
ncbi:hypothetical protein WDZ92_53125, partial [Nostoc sp. NIES-2111]